MMKLVLTFAVSAVLCCFLSGCGCSGKKDDAASEKTVERMKDAKYRKDLGDAVSQRAVLLEKRAKAAELAAKGDAEAKKNLEKIEKELDAIQKQAQDRVRARILEGAAKKGNLK